MERGHLSLKFKVKSKSLSFHWGYDFEAVLSGKPWRKMVAIRKEIIFLNADKTEVKPLLPEKTWTACLGPYIHRLRRELRSGHRPRRRERLSTCAEIQPVFETHTYFHVFLYHFSWHGHLSILSLIAMLQTLY